MSRSSLAATKATDAALRRIREIEPRVHAWVHLSEEEARTRAAAADQRACAGLSGFTVGVKDVIDVAGMPASYGSPIYAQHAPERTAETVARLETQGATVLGKTVTTEFALMTAGPTANPRRLTHTPGGSSSGSAAAVAAEMVDVGIGTQTYGSLIRPASYCGVLAHKPTFGVVSVDGTKVLAPSFDTLGWYARTFDVLEAVWTSFTGSSIPGVSPEPRIAIMDVTAWSSIDPVVPRIMRAVGDDLRASGREVRIVDLAESIDSIVRLHHLVAAHEISISLQWEFQNRPDGLSEPLRRFIAAGAAVGQQGHDIAARDLRVAVGELAKLFDDVDVLISPAASGEAPFGLEGTGDPFFCIPWTAIGAPVISIPAAAGATGLPVGIQLISAQFRDAELLQWGRALQPMLAMQADGAGWTT